MRILVVSNGFGEDMMGAWVARQLEKRGFAITVFPLVGEGKAYQKMGFSPVIHNPAFPSGGFLRRLSDVVADLRAGLLPHLMRQFKALSEHRKKADAVVVIGDVFALVWGRGGGRLSRRRPVFFLPTAKSDLFMRHSAVEIFCIRRLATRVFTRDAYTATSMAKKGLPAQWLGNVMMDGLRVTEGNLVLDPQKKVVLLLPGSREEAYPNAGYLIKLAVKIKTTHPEILFVMALAPTISVEELQRRELGLKESEVVVTEAFTDALMRADAVIGLAGTANEQAVYAGKTVIAFEGFGPQSTPRRFAEQRQLLGDRLVVVNRDPEPIMGAVERALAAGKSESEFNPESRPASDAIAAVIEIDLKKVSPFSTTP